MTRVEKVGILTLFGNFNYGNRLQNYALESAIKGLGYKVSTILPSENVKSVKPKVSKLSKLRDNPVKVFLKVIKHIYHIFRPNNSSNLMRDKKEPKLAPFTKDHLNTISMKQVNKFTFDAVFVGSDQVWNPNFVDNYDEFFLKFIEKGKRFAYAASFGLGEIPIEYKEMYSNGLKGIKTISVREERAVEIVTDLTGRKPELVADPTFLLTQADWQTFADRAGDTVKNKYILLYFLGELPRKTRKKIDEFAKSINAEIITIMGDRYNPTHWVPTVFEFAAAIRGAEAVFTDSFHSSVFSIIYNTPFITFDRAGSNMISRIDTLLGYFDLTDNHYTGTMSFEEIIKHTNFENVPMVLERERNKGLSFIQSCLDTIE